MTKNEFKKLFAFIQEFMNLWWWSLNYNFNWPKWENEIDPDYNYFTATIEFSQDILEENFDWIYSTILHEMCHIYTWSFRYYYNNTITDSLKVDVWINKIVALGNWHTTLDENYTVYLEKLLKWFLDKDKLFKKIRNDILKK